MKLGTFKVEERIFIGALSNGLVIDLAAAAMKSTIFGAEARLFTDMKTVVTNLSRVAELLQGGNYPPEAEYHLDQIQTLAPVTNPGKIICIGLNYIDHAVETNMEIPKEPVFFSKFATSITGPDSPVRIPRISNQIDYEAELAVVIGKRGKYIAADQAMEYVAGYTAFNDVSARDLQFRGGQWVKGKGLDTFAPMGPYLITADEITDPHKLGIKLILNGQEMQNSCTDQFIFRIPQLISFLSELVTLEPGDVIATGTPPGVGFARKQPVFLKAGDTMTVAIERVGELTNTVIGPER